MYLHKPLDKWVVTQAFGRNPQVYKQFGMAGHNGIDLRTRFADSPLGRRYVECAADGVVETVRWDTRGYGVHIRVRHEDGSLTIYGHLTKPYVQRGDKVKMTQRIGLTGNTGFSSGPHLHFEYRPAGWEQNKSNGYAGAVDPIPFFLA